MPLVSVVIPTFNRRKYICDAIDSVLNQSFRDFEIIVVDDGSTDGSGEVIEQKYGDAVRYVYQQNQGRSAARNAAMQLARGRYIAFLDSDDAWKPEKLERQIRILESSEDVGFVHTFTEVINADGSANHIETERRMKLYRKAVKRGYTFLGMSQECIMFLSSVMVRRSLVETVGPMDQELAAFEDWDWYLRMVRIAKIATLTQRLVSFRLHAGNTSTKEFIEGRIKTCRKHLGLLESACEDKIARSNFYAQMATAYYLQAESKQCTQNIWKALQCYPFALFKYSNARPILSLILPAWLMGWMRRAALWFRLRGNSYDQI